MIETIEISDYVSGLLEVGMALVFRDLQHTRPSEENGDAAAFEVQRSIAGHLCVLVSGGERTLIVRDPLDRGLLLHAVEAALTALLPTAGSDELKKFRLALLGIDDG